MTPTEKVASFLLSAPISPEGREYVLDLIDLRVVSDLTVPERSKLEKLIKDELFAVVSRAGRAKDENTDPALEGAVFDGFQAASAAYAYAFYKPPYDLIPLVG